MSLLYNLEFLMGIIIALLVGPILGSFLGMAVPRYRSGRSWWYRSECDYCGKELSLWALIPIVSFVVSRGKSLCCGKKLSVRYLWTEVIMTVLCLGIALIWGATAPFFILLPVLTLLMFQALLDLDRGILSPEASLSLCVLGIVFNLSLWFEGRDFETLWQSLYLQKSFLWMLAEYIGAGLVLWMIGLFLYYIYSGLRGIDLIGGGDVKFMPAAGCFLGLPEAFLYLITVSILQTFYMVCLRLKGGNEHKAFKKNEAPMGPALCLILYVWIIVKAFTNGSPLILQSFL